jgi:hypothetical protein
MAIARHQQQVALHAEHGLAPPIITITRGTEHRCRRFGHHEAAFFF